MTDQRPERPQVQAGQQPPVHPAEGNPATQPMSAAVSPAAAPAPAPRNNGWHQVTSTPGGRWAVGIAVAVLGALMLLSLGVAGFFVLRNHDRLAPLGQRPGGYSRGQYGQDGQGHGRAPDENNGYGPELPGMRGGLGMGGMGGLAGGTALHGTVTATVNGSTQPLVFQRGQVGAVSTTSVTLKSSDGFVGTYGRTTSTKSHMAAPVAGGQALVVARASDKVALTILVIPASSGVEPSN